jgi:hypothetical protein
MVTGKVFLRTVSLSLILILLVSCSSNTLVQLPSTPDQKMSAILSLEPGNTIQYSAYGSDSLNEGVLQEIAGDSLCIWHNGTEFSVATDGIDSLWVRQRSVRTGILTGALTGGIPGIGYGILAVLVAGVEGDDSSSNLLLVPLLGLAGAVGGGGIGACVGAAIPRWERLF